MHQMVFMVSFAMSVLLVLLAGVYLLFFSEKKKEKFAENEKLRQLEIKINNLSEAVLLLKKVLETKLSDSEHIKKIISEAEVRIEHQITTTLAAKRVRRPSVHKEKDNAATLGPLAVLAHAVKEAAHNAHAAPVQEAPKPIEVPKPAPTVVVAPAPPVEPAVPVHPENSLLNTPPSSAPSTPSPAAPAAAAKSVEPSVNDILALLQQKKPAKS